MSLMLTKIHQVILPLPHQQPIPGPTFHPHCPAKSKQQIKYMNSIKIPFSTFNPLNIIIVTSFFCTVVSLKMHSNRIVFINTRILNWPSIKGVKCSK